MLPKGNQGRSAPPSRVPELRLRARIVGHAGLVSSVHVDDAASPVFITITWRGVHEPYKKYNTCMRARDFCMYITDDRRAVTLRLAPRFPSSVLALEDIRAIENGRGILHGAWGTRAGASTKRDTRGHTRNWDDGDGLIRRWVARYRLPPEI